MQLFPLTQLAFAQVLKMSLTIHSAPSLVSDEETTFPSKSDIHKFEAGEAGVFDFVAPDGGTVQTVFSTTTTPVALDFFIDSYEKSVPILSRPLPTGRNVIGAVVYDVRAFRGATEVFTFDAPFSMTISYTEAQVGGLNEETLDVYSFDELQNIWIVSDIESRDTVENTITILTDHLTLFAILGKTITQAPTENPPVPLGGGIIPTPVIAEVEPAVEEIIEKEATPPTVKRKIASIRDVIESRDKALMEESRIIPRQLFDISLSIDDRIILNSEELVTRVTFVNFGTEPTLIDFIFTIVDESGVELYAQTEDIIVETEAVLTHKINVRALPAGKYTLVLRTLYNIDADDTFRQSFEISKARKLPRIFPLGAIVAFLIIVGRVLYVRRRSMRRNYSI